MVIKSPQETVIRTHGDLFELWRGLMGDGGFARRSLWMLFIGTSGRPEPVIVPIDDIPRRADKRLVDALRHIVNDIVGNGDVESVALLLSRPGPTRMSADDRGWARALRPISPRWPVHLATADNVQVFAPDDLLPSDAA